MLVFGEERRGLGPSDVELCERTVRIPMRGALDSLNLGVAAGVLLYEVLRRRDDSGRGAV